MRTTAFAVATLAIALAFAGCTGSGDEDADPTPTGTPTGTPSATPTGKPSATPTPGSPPPPPGQGGSNEAPSATLAANVTSGGAPLAVNFTVGGDDPDGDDLTFSLDADGDGDEDASGTVPGFALFTFAAAGNFTANVTVSDGELSATATATVSVGEAGGSMDPLTFTGSVAGPCATPPFVAGVCTDVDYPFTVPAGAASFTARVDFTGNAVDVDLYLLNPDGAAAGQSACANVPTDPPVGEDPLGQCYRNYDEEATVAGPAAGTWTARVRPYQGEDIGYTLTITFA